MKRKKTVTNDIQAVVYTTNTEDYAKLIGEADNLPVLRLQQAFIELPPGTEILFLGWWGAGIIQGFDQAAAYFSVRAVCGVGQDGHRSLIPVMRKAQSIPPDVAVYPLPGGPAQRSNLFDVISWIVHCTPSRTGRRELEEKLMRRNYYSPGREITQEELEEERQKQDAVARTRFAKFGLTPEQVAQMREEADARNYIHGQYRKDVNAPLGSVDNPVEVGMEGCSNTLRFDLDRGYWILTDGLGNGWIR